MTVWPGDPCDINYDVGNFLYVYGIANLYTGFYAAYGIYAYSGSSLNIWGGTIGYNYWITVSAYTPIPTVTVYGTDFSVSNGTIYSDPSGTWFTVNDANQFVVLTGTYGEYQGAPGGPINLSFSVASNTPIFLVDTGGGPGPITAQIDIKPGSYPNAINLGSNGVIPVAILSDSDFDATTVDPDTVSLAGSGVAVRGKGNKSLAHQEDVNGDGLMDLVVKVETENLDPDSLQDGFATLTGTANTGNGDVQFEGSDSIIIVPPEDPLP